MELQKNEVLQGSRIYLRTAQLSDVGEKYQTWLADPEVGHYLISGPQHYTFEQLSDYVLSQKTSPNALFLFIVLNHTQEPIGTIRLSNIDRRHGLGEIGIMIGEKSVWGKGYASEAIQVLSEYAFKKFQLHKINAGMCKGNESSLRAFEKAGYSLWGVRKNHFLVDNHYVDVYQVEKFKNG